MKVLIQQARVVDPASSHHGTVRDIFIENGIITSIASGLSPTADHVLKGDGLHVSPGWVDLFSNFADPGFEFKETVDTGISAAAAGGYTDVFVIPNTRPAIDTKSQVEYIRHRAASAAVTVHPIGAVSKNVDGKELAEMYDMHASGAIAFSDGLQPVQSAGILLKALQYVRAFEGVVIQIPDDKSVGAGGLMHEGIVSTRLGLPGKPIMAEELLVARDIKLARYTNSKLHFTGVTSPRSLEYIRRAKEAGLAITCSVTPYHLFFNDEDLTNYDTNLKVYPPLRNRQHVDALRIAVADGTVDCIATHHLPHETDSKVVEFEHASYGMVGLQTCYPALKTILPEVPESRWVELLSLGARRIFALPQPRISEGEAAVLTIFSPGGKTLVDEAFFKSKSRNSPFKGRTLNGRVNGIVNNGKLIVNA